MTLTVPSPGASIDASWGEVVTDFINGRTSRTSSTGAITTTQTQVIGLTLDANSLAAGDTYRIRAFGQITSTASATVTLRARCGPTTLTGNIVTSRAPTANNTASSDPVSVEMVVTVRSIGAGGTIIGGTLIVGNATQPFNSATFADGTSSTQALDTTVANILELTAVTGSVNTSVNFHTAVIEKIV